MRVASRRTLSNLVCTVYEYQFWLQPSARRLSDSSRVRVDGTGLSRDSFRSQQRRRTCAHVAHRRPQPSAGVLFLPTLLLAGIAWRSMRVAAARGRVLSSVVSDAPTLLLTMALILGSRSHPALALWAPPQWSSGGSAAVVSLQGQLGPSGRRAKNYRTARTDDSPA